MRRKPELVFLTGAGSGIGRATALRFGRMGATVIPTDINEATAEQTAQLIRDAGGSAHAYQLDVADGPAYEALAAKVRDEHGVPDVVVNNAGLVIGGSFMDSPVEDWQRTLDVHLMGVVHGCRLFGQQMVERGQGGHLVNISSIGGIIPVPVGPIYCTAKAGIRMLSECLHAELAKHDIGVTAICPSLINTNAAKNMTITDASVEHRAKTLGDIGMPLLGSDPDKVARIIVRSVRYNWTVVPVRPEAWLGYAAMRISPGLILFGGRFVNMENAKRLEGLVPSQVDGVITWLGRRLAS